MLHSRRHDKVGMGSYQELHNIVIILKHEYILEIINTKKRICQSWKRHIEKKKKKQKDKQITGSCQRAGKFLEYEGGTH